MKKLAKTLLTIVVIVVAFIASTAMVFSIRMNSQVKSFDRSGIDISQVSDGVYNGHSETDLVKVEVSVSDIILSIVLKHSRFTGKNLSRLANT